MTKTKYCLKTASKVVDEFFNIFYADYKLKIGVNKFNVESRLKRVRDYIEDRDDLKLAIKDMIPSDIVHMNVIYETAIFDTSSIIIPTCKEFSQKFCELCTIIMPRFVGNSAPILTERFIMIPFYAIRGAIKSYMNRHVHDDLSIFSQIKSISNMDKFFELYSEVMTYIYDSVVEGTSVKFVPLKLEMLSDETSEAPAEQKRRLFYPHVDTALDMLCNIKINYTWFHKEFLSKKLFGPTECTLIYNSILEFDDLDLVIDDVVKGDIQFDYLFTRNGKPVEESDFPAFSSEQIGKVIKHIEDLFTKKDVLLRWKKGTAELCHILGEYLNVILDEDLENIFLNFPREIISWVINEGTESWIKLWERLKEVPSLELYFRTSDILSSYEREIIEELDELDAEVEAKGLED